MPPFILYWDESITFSLHFDSPQKVSLSDPGTLQVTRSITHVLSRPTHSDYATDDRMDFIALFSPQPLPFSGHYLLRDSEFCRPLRGQYLRIPAGAYEGFCEDLARQNAVAHLSQLQLRFRRRHIWVSVIRGVIEAII
jgi:hypothetical protein